MFYLEIRHELFETESIPYGNVYSDWQHIKKRYWVYIVDCTEIKKDSKSNHFLLYSSEKQKRKLT